MKQNGKQQNKEEFGQYFSQEQLQQLALQLLRGKKVWCFLLT